MSDNGSSLTRKMNNDFAYQESPEGTVYRPFSISTMNRILNAYEGYQESPDFDFQSYSSSSSGGTPGAGLSSELQGTLKVSGVSESPGSPPISMTRKRSLFNDNFKDDSENKVSSLFGPEDDSENQIPSSLGQTPVKAESNVTKEGGDVGGTRKRSIQRNPRSVLAEITNNCFEPVLNVSGELKPNFNPSFIFVNHLWFFCNVKSSETKNLDFLTRTSGFLVGWRGVFWSTKLIFRITINTPFRPRNRLFRRVLPFQGQSSKMNLKIVSRVSNSC